MGLFDDVSSLVGKSLDAADKKAQQLKLQTQLTHLDAKKAEVLSELGRTVLVDMKSDPRFLSTYSEQIGAITDLESQAAQVREKIKMLQTAPATLVSSAELEAALSTAPTVQCPQCKTRVNLTDSFCSSCGKDIASIKAEIKKCAKCNRVYGAEVAFCEVCGSPTQPYELTEEPDAPLPEEAETIKAPEEPPCDEPPCSEPPCSEPPCSDPPCGEPVHQAPDEPAASSEADAQAEVPAEPRCPACGNPAIPDALFCGYCGSSLK